MPLRLIKTLLLIVFISLVGCDKEEVQEIDIIILSTITEGRSEPNQAEVIKFGIVEYYAKNVGLKKINGWEVFFNLHVERGPQQLAYESVYYSLKPNEISEVRTVVCMIPQYYEDAYKATLKHVETW